MRNSQAGNAPCGALERDPNELAIEQHKFS